MAEENKGLNFIEEIVEEDIRNNKHGGRILTRFPPEPNGYLHIGHAKSICLNFGLAQKYGGKTNLRFDDTNPVTEEVEYIDSIKDDIRWLGFEWGNREFYASDYFQQIYDFAVKLIKAGKAYVDDLTAEEIANLKGTPTSPATPSPYRDRSVAENLSLFEDMKAGKFKEGEKVLRAKVDLASPNMHMRDPIMYRILFTPHHRTGKVWCIYPMYDFAHGQSDSIEGITHSICTLEFENHRPLYNWYIDNLEIFPSRQIEFARLNLNYTVMSKRKLLQLVKENLISGWDDPRMPTIRGMRRRGYTAQGLRNFATTVGIAKRNNLIEFSLLEHCIREDLNKVSTRTMVVTEPLLVEIVNYPKDQIEWLPMDNNPEMENSGRHDLPFSSQIFIEQEDYMDDPPPKFFRLTKGGMARLRSAYIIECIDVEYSSEGTPTKLLCRYIPESKSGQDTSGLKVKTTIHWVEMSQAIDVDLNLYDRLFTVEEPDKQEDDFKAYLNPNSLSVIKNAKAEPFLKQAVETGITHFQFLRKAYYVHDANSNQDRMVFNRTVELKDNWSKGK